MNKTREKFRQLIVQLMLNSPGPSGNTWHIACTKEEVEELKKLYSVVDASWCEDKKLTMIEAYGNKIILQISSNGLFNLQIYSQ